MRDVETTEQHNQFLGGIHVYTANAVTISPWVTPIYVNKRVVNFKIDTGADVTVVSNKEYDPKMAHFLLLTKH